MLYLRCPGVCSSQFRASPRPALTSAPLSSEFSANFQAALVRGLELAELNVAIVLELEGSTALSVKRFEKALDRMRANDLPDRHVMVKMATVSTDHIVFHGNV